MGRGASERDSWAEVEGMESKLRFDRCSCDYLGGLNVL